MAPLAVDTQAAMPVFEAKHLDGEFEGQSLLAAILHATPEARTRALRVGRRRAAGMGSLAARMSMEPRSPASDDGCEPVAIPSS